MPIRVFYHVYIPDDIQCYLWNWYLDQQLGMIRSSNLHKVAQVFMCVTMPLHWTDTYGIPILSGCHPQTLLPFGEKLREYVSLRYPWVTILEMRDSSENIFEGSTLAHIHQQSQNEDFVALYIHTKGIHSCVDTVTNWKDILNHYHINGWCSAIKHLQTHQVVAINDAHSQNNPIVSGNFWWSTSSYLRTLLDPLDTSKYTHEQQLWPGQDAYRYGFELWILSGQPSVHYWANTNTNHYYQYCFLENLLQQYPLD